MWIAPFGNLRIDARLQLPAAYRSLSRPSSAPSAKAFALRPFSLDLFIRAKIPLFSRIILSSFSYLSAIVVFYPLTKIKLIIIKFL